MKNLGFFVLFLMLVSTPLWAETAYNFSPKPLPIFNSTTLPNQQMAWLLPGKSISVNAILAVPEKNGPSTNISYWAVVSDKPFRALDCAFLLPIPTRPTTLSFSNYARLLNEQGIRAYTQEIKEDQQRFTRSIQRLYIDSVGIEEAFVVALQVFAMPDLTYRRYWPLTPSETFQIFPLSTTTRIETALLPDKGLQSIDWIQTLPKQQTTISAAYDNTRRLFIEKMVLTYR
ncbi:MAG: hypothetical protein AB7F28_03140 [Candidatus Margulisiibacteriota bacterium]